MTLEFLTQPLPPPFEDDEAHAGPALPGEPPVFLRSSPGTPSVAWLPPPPPVPVRPPELVAVVLKGACTSVKLSEW